MNAYIQNTDNTSTPSEDTLDKIFTDSIKSLFGNKKVLK